MDVKRLETTAAVIEALGGNQPTAEIAGAAPKTVSMWRSFPNFPPKTYLALTAALSERGCEAPPSLWGMMGAVPEMERASS